MSSCSARIRQISDLETENAGLRKQAADLTAYLLALRNALSDRLSASPRCDDSPREAI
jgi:hypothetical protein